MALEAEEAALAAEEEALREEEARIAAEEAELAAEEAALLAEEEALASAELTAQGSEQQGATPPALTMAEAPVQAAPEAATVAIGAASIPSAPTRLFSALHWRRRRRCSIPLPS